MECQLIMSFLQVDSDFHFCYHVWNPCICSPPHISLCSLQSHDNPRPQYVKPYPIHPGYYSTSKEHMTYLIYDHQLYGCILKKKKYGTKYLHNGKKYQILNKFPIHIVGKFARLVNLVITDFSQGIFLIILVNEQIYPK